MAIAITDKRKKKKIKLSKFIGAVLVIGFICYASYTLIYQQYIFSKGTEVSAEYDEKISKAKEEQDKLRQELKNSKTDDYLQRQAREKLGMVKANERVFIDSSRN